MNNQILTTGEIADRWDCSQEFVRSLIRNGKLRPEKRWDELEHYRISLEEVLKTEYQLVQSNFDSDIITLLTKALGVNRRYAREYANSISEKKEDVNTAKGR